MAIWMIDPDHSCATFAVRHFGLAHVRGQFTTVKGSIEFDLSDPSHARVEVEIPVAGVNTGNKKRDEHLLTADFFDQPPYPLITFKSIRIDFPGENRCRVRGNLTIHGTTREITFDGEYAGPSGNPYGDETSIGFSGSLRINREDFGMMWGSQPMQGGGLVLGKEVQIFLDVEADMVK